MGGGLGLARALGGAQADDRGPHRKSDDAESDAEQQQGAGVERRGIGRRQRGAKRQQTERNGAGDDAEQHFWPP